MTNTEATWNILRQKCLRYSKLINAWQNKVFDSTECVHLYCINAGVQKYNNECITKLEKPITNIEDKNIGRGR